MPDSPRLTVIVVLYEMYREAPRTLHTLSAEYQRGVDASDYEVIVLDNGSPRRRAPSEIEQFGPNFRYQYVENPGPSPGPAINAAIEASDAEFIGICYDGGRMLSPGVLKLALQATQVNPDPFVVTLGFELGPDIQMHSQLNGYNESVEDKLLEQADWKNDGYRLFDVATLGSSSGDGWFGQLSESSCFFMRRRTFQRIGGFSTGFTMGGGGLLNLDIYREACEDSEMQLVGLLGEGNFHQVHGAMFNNATPQEHAAKLAEAMAMYEQVRGRVYAVPEQQALYLGRPSRTVSRSAGEARAVRQNEDAARDCDTKHAVRMFECLRDSTSLRLGNSIGRLVGLRPTQFDQPDSVRQATDFTVELLNSVTWELGAPLRLARMLVARLRQKFRRHAPTNRVEFVELSRHASVIDAVERPLFLIGTARSGTTWLAEQLGHFPTVNYCPFELRRVWSSAGGVPMASPETGDRTNPALDASDVWDGQADSLRAGFRRRLAEQLKGEIPVGAIQFLNKSPHLCNKLGLVNELFPEARYIWIHRPLMHVVASLKSVFLDIQQRQSVEHYWPEADVARPPRYFHTIFDGLNRDSVSQDRIFPGGDIRHLAEYWLESNQAVAEFFSDLPENRGIVVSHESLLDDAQYEFVRMAQFLGEDAAIAASLAESTDQSRNTSWQERLTDSEIGTLRDFSRQHHDDITRLFAEFPKVIPEETVRSVRRAA